MKNKITVSDYHFVINEEGKREKRPGQLMVSFGIKSVSQSDKEAEEILKNCNLSDNQKSHIMTRLAQFIDTYSQLERHLHKPIGNVPQTHTQRQHKAGRCTK